ncbi:hypothetical protein RJT34_17383 [Clitoria ternatea]|uniref:Uncharacterized protein n=1 Tax=Clitoria ternatea TaxID=43366 RepID=A0AAN9JA56_CLITE
MMDFLHKLWDETVAGPIPETGLGKLRKYHSFSVATARSPVVEDVPVSRSITIVRTQSGFHQTTSDHVSRSVPITPRTPLPLDTPGGDFKKFTRWKSSTETADNRSPTIYDWVIMSAVDCY